MALGDNNHPFFRPLWRRILLVAVCTAWALTEWLVVGDMTWAAMTGLVAAYAAWTFLITYPAQPAEPIAKD